MKKQQPLQNTLWEIEKKYGQGVIGAAAHRSRGSSLSTGYPALDQALCAGGLALGRLSVLMGVPTSGATSCAYRIIAQGQKNGGFAAYLDLALQFDPEVAHDNGVMLSQLLIIRAADAAQAIDISRDIVLANAADVLVIDAVKAHITPQYWERFADAVARSNCVVALIIYHPAQVVESVVQTWLTFERQAWLTHDEGVAGYQTRVTIMKDKPRIKTESVLLDITFKGMSD